MEHVGVLKFPSVCWNTTQANILLLLFSPLARKFYPLRLRWKAKEETMKSIWLIRSMGERRRRSLFPPSPPRRRSSFSTLSSHWAWSWLLHSFCFACPLFFVWWAGCWASMGLELLWVLWATYLFRGGNEFGPNFIKLLWVEVWYRNRKLFLSGKCLLNC